MMNARLVILALVVAVGSLPARAAEEPAPVATIEDLPREARLALFTAQQHLEKGENEKAANAIGTYVRDHARKNDSFLMRYHYAGLLVQIDRRTEALAEYERAVALEPRYGAAWLGLGETAYGLGQYERAAAGLEKGYALMDEKRPDVLYYAAAARVLAGDAAGAIPMLEDLVTGTHGTPKLEWYRGLVSACLQTGNADSGRRAVSGMLDRFGTSPDAWYLAFQFNASVSDYRHAAIALTVVGYLRPLSRQEQLQLGDLYAAIEAPAAAAGYYAAAVADSASVGEVERIASAYLASYQPDAALEVLERALDAQPTFRLWSLLGDLHVMEKRFQPAYDAFVQCSQLAPGEPRPHLMLGYCAIELNRPDDAVVHLQAAAGDEEFAERAQMLIRRAQIMRAAPTP